MARHAGAGAERLDLVVHGGQVVTSTDVLDVAIGIKDEKIVALAPADLLPPAERTIDARGKYVLPGAMDCHIHLGPEYDDWRGGPIAAAHAGLTTLLGFALYDHQARETLPQAIKRLRDETEQQSVLDFGFHFILAHTPYILDGIPEAVEMGVTSFKLFMTYKKRPPRMCPDDFVIAAMERIAKAGGVTQLHCENGDVLDFLENRAIAEGRTAPKDFPPTCPDWAEEEAINRAITMGAMTGSPVYVVHLSTRLGLERIKAAQVQGQRVWTETCPQYLLLDDSLMERWGPYAKMGPPLRPATGPDRDAMWNGLAGGFIATVGSDHAPRVKAAKEPGWKNIFVDPEGKPIPFGNPSVETMVPLMYSEGVVKRGLPLTWMARVLAENPARIFGLYPRKGAIRVGSDADLLIIDPEPEWTVTANELRGIAGMTLYEGWRMRGRPWMTLLRGRVLLNQRKLEQEPGYGRYLARTAPRPPLGGAVR
ncbi:MAG: amidohydrolase family protein [Candidatus Rokubacteria bacterium]|nr:amidohydrolase family protein [Candidatus Rokubacteria bacterium]